MSFDDLHTRNLQDGLDSMKKQPHQGVVRLFSESIGAGNETRTRDNQLGKLGLYQLSYARSEGANLHRGKGDVKQPRIGVYKLST